MSVKFSMPVSAITIAGSADAFTGELGEIMRAVEKAARLVVGQEVAGGIVESIRFTENGAFSRRMGHFHGEWGIPPRPARRGARRHRRRRAADAIEGALADGVGG